MANAPLAEAPETIVARVNGEPIPLSRLQGPLIEGYGLNVLLNLVQLELAEQFVRRGGLVVTEQDVEAERARTLSRMFAEASKEDYDALFEQFLQNQRISRPEFDLVVRINAHLRKLAEPQVAGKITEANLEEAWRQLYGEKVVVRHVQASNPQELQEARRRLAAGEKFEDVARDLSRNTKTAPLGGELPAFTLQTPGLPQAFKDAAFALREGEISDIVQAEDAYHLIRLEQRIAPRVVKFEDVKQSIREDLEERALEVAMKELRGQLGQQAVQTMVIDHPVLRQQFDAKREKRQGDLRERNQIRQELSRQRERLATRPATEELPDRPVPEPRLKAAPVDTITIPPPPEAGRPPATRPAAAGDASRGAGPANVTTRPDTPPDR